MDITTLFILFLTGISVGFINVISAGGSLISLPILIFLGLPSSVANGTNRIGILVQNITAFIEFYRKGYVKWKLSLLLAIPAILGSFIGAELAIDLPDTVFNRIVGMIMIVVIFLILFKPHQYFQSTQKILTLRKKLLLIGAFLFVGFYGGFIQAGVGFLIIAFLTIIVGEYSLVEMHSIKTVVTFFYLLLSTFVFIAYGQINWSYAIILAIGGGIGGWLGSRFAIHISEKILKITMTIVIVILALMLLL